MNSCDAGDVTTIKVKILCINHHKKYLVVMNKLCLILLVFCLTIQVTA